MKQVRLTLGVNNIADKDPPLVPSGTFSSCPTIGCNDNTWPGMYDTMGRYIFAHVEVKFWGRNPQRNKGRRSTMKAAGFGPPLFFLPECSAGQGCRSPVPP